MKESINQAMGAAIFGKDPEKSSIDKALASKEAEELRALMKKDNLSRSDLNEIMYLLGGIESKLVNYDLQMKRVMNKYFVWIRDIVALAEDFHELKDEVKHSTTLKQKDKAERKIKQLQNQVQHVLKFLIDLYMVLSRSTLSLEGKGFFGLMNKKYEIAYSDKETKTIPGVK